MAQVQGEETTNCKLLDLPQEMIEEIMIRQDARGQANFRTTCRTLFDMSKDPFYQSQRDKLAPGTEPVYNFLYLPVMTTEGYPRGWDPVRGTWRVLPSLSFLPKGRISSVSHLHGYRTGTRSYNASGLLLLGFLPLSEYSNTKMRRGHTEECLCLCNPLTRKAVFVRPPPAGPIASLTIQGQLRAYASSFTVRQPHWYMVLHTRSGTTAGGFTLYAMAGAPSALLKLHVQAPQLAIGAIRVGALDQQMDLGISESNADWTTITRRRPAADGHVQAVSDLIRLADPVVVGGVVRSLCMRERVAQGQAPGPHV